MNKSEGEPLHERRSAQTAMAARESIERTYRERMGEEGPEAKAE